MRIEAGVAVNVPVDTVFADVAQVERWPDWSQAVERARWIDGESMRPGAQFEETTQFLRRRIEQRHEVIAYQPPQYFAYRALTGPLQQTSHFHFLPAGEGTRITVVSEGDTGSFSRLAKPLIVWIGQRQLEKELRALMTWLERKGT